MRERGSGLLLFVSSGMAQLIFPFAGLYAATKRAMEGLAESYRYQLAPLGIDVAILEPGGYLTDIYSKPVIPADTAHVASYGPLAGMPQKFFEGYIDALKGPDAPHPREVADALVTLIEAPAGQRPLRTVVDWRFGQTIQAINDAVSAVQKSTFSALGLQDILSVKPR
jgi:NAD(P)-dependent dehydrogenase (short-subunit alcohol dehydrogenase family)